MRLWLIPSCYTTVAVVGGVVLPRVEAAWFPLNLSLSVGSAQAFLSAVSSGMMALTGIVFSIAFVMVQFSAIAYSPRLVVWFARDHTLFHAMGIFIATFIYSLCTLAWVDRADSGSVPMVSCIIVGAMLAASTLLFARLVQRLSDLQIGRVLYAVGDRGREVILDTYAAIPPARTTADAPLAQARTTQTIQHQGEPRSVVSLDIAGLVRMAHEVHATIVMACAVGDTLVEGTDMLHVHGGQARIAETRLRKAVRLGEERTFDQDPKYSIRILVDIAIKALSPAINDPTTAVQAIDQIEDLLRRLSMCNLDTFEASDAEGAVRVVFQMPSWNDYLALAFDEIRQYGAGSIQVMRRLRSALADLVDACPPGRAQPVADYLAHLDSSIDRSPLDPQDRAMARVEDRQGIGISRRIDDEAHADDPVRRRSSGA